MIEGDKKNNRLVIRQDIVHIAVLLAIALCIGVYLIVTTVLMTEDGVDYIKRAQEFSRDPIKVIKEWHPFGYPFLIFLSHKFATLFSDSSSVRMWIYSAQGVTLLSRMFALIPLYLIGKLLVGGRKSFLALLILILLPYPARFGSDVLREWPHILFLATGFLFLLLGAKDGKLWMFAMAGFAAGLGHMIRAECAQLVIYGVLWLLIGLFLPKRNMTRFRMVCALLILLACFSVSAVPYMKAKEGKYLPSKLRRLISSSVGSRPEKIQGQDVDIRDCTFASAGLPANMAKGIGRLIEQVSESFMYYFMPALLIGIYFCFHRRSETTYIERFFIPAFIAFNVIILLLLYINYEYISRRHCMPLVVFTVFYIPEGFWILAAWLSRNFLKDKQQWQRRFFYILLIIGIVLCIAKLIKPARTNKQSYLAAAKWLSENTDKSDLVAANDSRISFYSGRQWIQYNNRDIPAKGRYLVKIFDEGSIVQTDIGIPDVKEIFAVGGGDKGSKVVIYDLCNSISDRISLVDYQWEKKAEGRYEFEFIFKVYKKLEGDYKINFHGWVKDEDVELLGEADRKRKFAGWGFNPEPPTSAWGEDECVTIRRVITAEPITYNLNLGFYMAGVGRYGRQVNLGWVDLRDTQPNRDSTKRKKGL